MSYAVNDVWGQWSNHGAGATITVTNGILNIQDASNATNGNKYIQLSVRGGDKLVFRAMARAVSGSGKMWINLTGIGVTVAAELPISGNTDFEAHCLEYTIPHSYGVVDAFIGIGCTLADVGQIEAYAPTVYLNGTAADFLLGYAGVVSKGGKFGIGTVDPAYKLHVSGGGNPSVAVWYYEDGTGGAAYTGVKHRGTPSAPTAVQANDFLSSLLASAYTGSGYTGNIGLVGFQAAENITGSAQGTEFQIGVTPVGSTGRIERLRIRNNGNVRPGIDNTQSLGEAAIRWSVVYAGTGTINTSDEREKTPAKPIEDAILRAWTKVEYCQFKFLDAVNKKGDGARWHFGLVAQRVKEAFEAEGIDPFQIGILCYDEWDEQPAQIETWGDEFDEAGNLVRAAGSQITAPYRPAGNRYGIRYEEALALEAALMRRRIEALEASI